MVELKKLIERLKSIFRKVKRLNKLLYLFSFWTGVQENPDEVCPVGWKSDPKLSKNPKFSR